MPKTCQRQVNQPSTRIELVDVPSTCISQKTITETVFDKVPRSRVDTYYVDQIQTSYTTKSILVADPDDLAEAYSSSPYDSHSDDSSDYHYGHGHHALAGSKKLGKGAFAGNQSSANRHARVTKRIPHYNKVQVPRESIVNYTEEVPRQVSRVIDIEEPCTKQEERVITENNLVSESYDCSTQERQCALVDNLVSESYDCSRQEEQCALVDNLVSEAYDCSRQEQQCALVDNLISEAYDCSRQEQQCELVDNFSNELYDCSRQETITELIDNFVEEQYACSKQEVQNFTRTETYTEKEPYVETINYPTTTTNQVPRTVLINKTKQVDSHSIGQEAYTRKQNIAARRIEQAPTSSIEAVRNDSSRLADKIVTVQEAVPESYNVVRKVPRSVSSTRQRASYSDVDASTSYDTKIQGTATLNQQLVRQATLRHAHSTLSLNNPNLDFIDADSVSISDLAGEGYGYSSYAGKGYRKHW